MPLILDRLGDLVLEVRIGVDDIPTLRHCIRPLTAKPEKDRADAPADHLVYDQEEELATTTITNTIAVVIMVSCASARSPSRLPSGTAV